MINILGQVAGKGIELVGVGLLLGAKALSGVTRGLFFLGSKHVDMVETLKDMKNSGNGDNYGALPEAEQVVLLPPGEEAPQATENGKIVREFNLVRSALEYSNRAYAERMLPVEEVLRVDNQALIMAKAIEQYLKKHADYQLKKEYGRTAGLLVQACSLFMKYHRSGDEQFYKEAERILDETIGQTRILRPLNPPKGDF